ncbi:DUF4275 family protein [Bacillus infantis]|uniref:DUF4275 family protein n=1 Tax=Bacillus infantis TaxID=324767 RepID=UPI003CF63866
MDIVDRFRQKNIKILEIPKWGPYLRKEWENNFASHLNEKEKKAIHLLDEGGFGGYLWHLFSYKKKDCLEGENAKKAFNSARKNKIYVFFQHSDFALLLENASTLHTEDLIDEIGTDMYIVDKQFRWTFILTHETGWLGPYFSRK